MINFLSIKNFVVVGILALAGISVLGFSGATEPVFAASCTNGSSYKDFDGSYTRNSLTVQTKDNKKLCKDVKVNFTTFEVLNKNYNGKGFKNNSTALPQASIFNKTVTLKKGTNGKTTVQVAVPDACTPYQIDAYIGSPQTKVTTSAGLIGTNAIVGKLFQRTKSVCTVKVCNPATGEIITVHESKKNDYKPIGDEACKPTPEKTKVCNPKTGETITVEKDQTDMYKPVGDKACKNLQVCNPETGETITVKGSEAADYKPVDDSACQDVPAVVELPETGAGDSIMGLLGATLLTGTATAFLRSRR